MTNTKTPKLYQRNVAGIWLRVMMWILDQRSHLSVAKPGFWGSRFQVDASQHGFSGFSGSNRYPFLATLGVELLELLELRLALAQGHECLVLATLWLCEAFLLVDIGSLGGIIVDRIEMHRFSCRWFRLKHEWNMDGTKILWCNMH